MPHVPGHNPGGLMEMVNGMQDLMMMKKVNLGIQYKMNPTEIEF